MVIKKIILPLDGSKLAEKALPYAEALATKFQAELILVGIIQPASILTNYPEIASQIAEEEKSNFAAYQKMVRDHLFKRHLAVRTAVLQAHSVADAIIALAEQEAVDLVVMSTHGRSGLSRWVYGSVAGKILQHAPCPVFLVRAGTAES